MRKFNRVVIKDEAYYDSGLTCNIGTVVKVWNEPLPNDEPTPLVQIQLDNGIVTSVGQHEVIVIKYH